MNNTIELLIINGSDALVPEILDSLQQDSHAVNYWRANNEQQIVEMLRGNVQWNLILLAESENWTETLKLIQNFSPDIPTVFICNSPLAEVAVPAMRNGANDCIPEISLAQLLPIFKREQNHQVTKQRYQNAQKKTDILGSIINNSSDEVFLFDSEIFDCLYVNQPVLQNNGYSAQEITQITPADIYDEYDLTAFQKLVSPLLDGNREQISICSTIQHSSGKPYQAEIQLKLMDRDGHRFLLAINKDISYQQDKTQKLKKQHKLTVQYRLQNKQKADFLANAAHDMRTSLTSIILSNRLLSEKRISDSSELDSLTNAIHHSGNHLLKYISEFFNTSDSQLDPQKIETACLNIKSFSKELHHIFKPIAADKNLSFAHDTSGLKDKNIQTNATYLKRILKNLLSNAFKYTEEGEVKLEVYSTESGQAPLNAKHTVVFQISDTGMGIPESDKKAIFKRHSRTSTSQSNNLEGSGLGLHICKKLTEALGGKLEFKSTANKGTTFFLYLGADDAETKPPPKKKKRKVSSGPAKADKTILVLDDSNIHNLAAKEFLSYSFSECLTATTKEQAYKILEENLIDCFVLDYIINDTDSFEVARYIQQKQKYSDTPIIVYTGKILKQEEREKLNKFADAIVKKAAGSYNTLIDAIESALGSDAIL